MQFWTQGIETKSLIHMLTGFEKKNKNHPPLPQESAWGIEIVEKIKCLKTGQYGYQTLRLDPLGGILSKFPESNLLFSGN